MPAREIFSAYPAAEGGKEIYDENLKAIEDVLMKKHGFDAQFKESPGAHTWINWRNYLAEFAPQLFQ